ncbi:hypothetical protein CFN78_26680 [Amycolatopsis antarctica]|uniref:VCBS repeat-containing protein n=1 Tax=Amycolatopsis antarctica TaxID=1854586 RepID=A0A263CW15_9PSEU|nr:VCBS repeat-containing protein [Amycolatopsis antarctica]OZM70159.1 hypothetical protein CFN78_26680 [Amycolatopsis antarctica]
MPNATREVTNAPDHDSTREGHTMRRTTKTVVTMTALTAGLFALPVGIASAQEIPQVQQAAADLDGDGTADLVTLTPLGDGSVQSLRFTVNGVENSVEMPADAYRGVLPLRVTDINGDGSQEVVVTESMGANTATFSVWDRAADGAPRGLTTEDGQPLKLNEGGGAASRVGYECAASATGRDLITLAASNVGTGTDLVYDGSRVRYQVQDGVATPVDDYTITGALAGDPVLDVDTAACA